MHSSHPGDVSLRSWFEAVITPLNSGIKTFDSDAETEWWRVLSLGITGFCGGVWREETDFNGLSSATDPIDLEIVLRKPTVRGRELSLRGKLSSVNLTLKYSDYVLVRAIARDNIGRKGDAERWDNVEKAYWLEEDQVDDAAGGSRDIHSLEIPGSSSKSTENRVAYSSNARFIRYGKGGKRAQKIEHSDMLNSSESGFKVKETSEKANTNMNMQFELGGLSLKLRRDDEVEVGDDQELSLAFNYDMMLLRVQIVEISVTTNGSGDLSFHLSLFRIGLFDLGDRGRLTRERYYYCLPNDSVSKQRVKRKPLRQPCPFHVLIEGYAPVDEGGDDPSPKSEADGPQFVVSVDRCPASSAGAIGSFGGVKLEDDAKVTIARLVINYLSCNVLIRPFKEIIEFVSCDWPTRNAPVRVDEQTRDKGGPILDSKESESVSTTSQSRGFQLKLVAHYPRVFFVADESDIHSRALVLRG